MSSHLGECKIKRHHQKINSGQRFITCRVKESTVAISKAMLSPENEIVGILAGSLYIVI
jgi:hypothetical protein